MAASCDLSPIAQQYGCTVSRTEHCDRNQGASSIDEIMLGEFDDPDIEIVAFFHELGHCVANKLLPEPTPWWLSKISCEGIAWEVGLSLARKHGFVWSYYSKQLKYARECLRSYRDNDQNWC